LTDWRRRHEVVWSPPPKTTPAIRATPPYPAGPAWHLTVNLWSPSRALSVNSGRAPRARRPQPQGPRGRAGPCSGTETQGNRGAACSSSQSRLPTRTHTHTHTHTPQTHTQTQTRTQAHRRANPTHTHTADTDTDTDTNTPTDTDRDPHTGLGSPMGICVLGGRPPSEACGDLLRTPPRGLCAWRSPLEALLLPTHTPQTHHRHRHGHGHSHRHRQGHTTGSGSTMGICFLGGRPPSEACL